jgi:hypothetical protein
MKLVADEQGRIGCRELFHPRHVFDAAKQPDGSIRVVEVAENGAPRAKLVRRGNRTYLESERIVTNEDVEAAMSQFP